MEDESVSYYIKLTPEIVGKIDVLIHEGLYDTRNNFIERALNEQFSLYDWKFDEY